MRACSIMSFKDACIFKMWNPFYIQIQTHLLLNCEPNLFDTAYKAKLLGNSYYFSLKNVPFRVTFVLCCCRQAENMPSKVLITRIQSSGRTGKRQLLQGHSTTKHFYTMFSSVNTKEFPFTCQHDYSVQCFPLNAKRWSQFPTWSYGMS